ncbi:MAG: carboxypeptidase-like regulatory domain-containing protein [Bacteroidetes bacterium]|nr:carboxypeptidase-like regulatory domain-containing protein [Bacteroidota bacterium]MCL2302513.1 carboxypeptidase-like regulatory domain-containing protein [Lentimicrobiaceae bacterium]
MLKNIFKLLLILCVALAFSCHNTTSFNREKADLSNTDFIYLKGNYFKLRNEKFYPIMLNYCVSFRNLDNNLVVSPYINYEKVGEFEYHTKEETEEQLRGHFQLIKEMGFNSIRVTFDRGHESDGKYYYSDFSIDNDYEKILAGFEDFINIATEKDLRVMFLFKAPFNKPLEDFAIKVLERFNENPTIFAYDFLNEPLYFDPEPKRSKESARNLQLRWKAMMDQYAPNQLFTIGFAEPIEVFSWDPSMSPVDFVCIHTYHPLRVKSELYWYSKYIDKPLMIGEIALPADGDSVPYSHQANFAKEISEYAIDCGIAGFGWWDFQEDLALVGHTFEGAYTGILNNKGTTTTADGNYTIIGTVKPVAEEIKKISQYQSKNIKEKPVNYYNNLGYNNFVIKGKVIDQKTKKPIEGAVIRGWTEWWHIAWNTYSDENGNFTLYSNYEFVRFTISAPGFSTVLLNKTLKYNKIAGENFDINNLPNKELEYHSICYKSFLKENTHSVFDFEPSKFNQAKFEANIGTIKLRRIDY